MYVDYKTYMFSFQFIIYNVIPYSTLMLLHHHNFKQNKDKGSKRRNKNPSNTVLSNSCIPSSHSDSSKINGGRGNLLKTGDAEHDLNSVPDNSQVLQYENRSLNSS